MAQILMPRRRGGQLGALSKALGIASQIYGIKTNSEKLEIMRQREEREQERFDRQGDTAEHKKTLDAAALQRKLDFEQRQVAEGVDPTSLLIRKKDLAAQALKRKLDLEDEQLKAGVDPTSLKVKELSLREKAEKNKAAGFAQSQQLFGLKVKDLLRKESRGERRDLGEFTKIEALEAANKLKGSFIADPKGAFTIGGQKVSFKKDLTATELRQQQLAKKEAADQKARANVFRYKTSKLGGEARKRLDNIRMARSALNQMTEARAAGQNTKTLFGDNDFTFGASQWEEAIGRMQSGGAINSDEGTRFLGLVPGITDSARIQAKKLKTMGDLMDQRLQTFDLAPDEVPDYIDPTFDERVNAIITGKEIPKGKTGRSNRSGGASSGPTLEDLKRELLRRKGN
jgi:hypothetical protein